MFSLVGGFSIADESSESWVVFRRLVRAHRAHRREKSSSCLAETARIRACGVKGVCGGVAGGVARLEGEDGAADGRRPLRVRVGVLPGHN